MMFDDFLDEDDAYDRDDPKRSDWVDNLLDELPE